MGPRASVARVLILLALLTVPALVITAAGSAGAASGQARDLSRSAHQRGKHRGHGAATRPRHHHRKRHRHHHPKAGATNGSPKGTASGSGSGSASSIPAGAPAAGFYVDPSDSAALEYNQLVASGDATDAAQIAKIADQPEGIWLTNSGSLAVVPQVMQAAQASGTVPIFVVYDIPDRDCGGDSSGGATSGADYEGFIDSLVGGLGRGRAVVVVEPDALSFIGQGCMPGSNLQLIGYAVQRLNADANAAVYVDAGNPGWQPAAQEAAELQTVLGSQRGGFSINVSNFVGTSTDLNYGMAISQASGGRHFVIDTSRNGGHTVAGQWCNPSGAGIGQTPTTATGNSLVDAFLWIKDVGESDGSDQPGLNCNGGPPAGQFWLAYALSNVANGS